MKDTAWLARYVEDLIRTHAPAAMVNVAAEEVTANEMLNIADQVQASQQALDYLRGPVLYSSVEAEQTTNSTVFTNLTTTGPSITVPKAGRYMLGWGAMIRGNSTTGERALVSFDGTDANSVQFADVGHSGGNSAEASVARLLPITATQGQVITLTYRSVTGSTYTFGKRWITAWEIPA